MSDKDSTPTGYWYWTQARRDAYWASLETPKETYTRQEQLFDAALAEAQHGDPRKQKFFFGLAERLLKMLK